MYGENERKRRENVARDDERASSVQRGSFLSHRPDARADASSPRANAPSPREPTIPEISDDEFPRITPASSDPDEFRWRPRENAAWRREQIFPKNY